jgi:hypothetical protein
MITFGFSKQTNTTYMALATPQNLDMDALRRYGLQCQLISTAECKALCGVPAKREQAVEIPRFDIKAALSRMSYHNCCSYDSFFLGDQDILSFQTCPILAIE